MKNSEDLRRALRAIDHKSYPAYKDLKGSYSFGNYVLSIDHVQGDPFASPSRLSILVDGKTAGFPVGLYDTRYKRVALQDYLNRLFYQEIEKYTFKAKGSRQKRADQCQPLRPGNSGAFRRNHQPGKRRPVIPFCRWFSGQWKDYQRVTAGTHPL